MFTPVRTFISARTATSPCGRWTRSVQPVDATTHPPYPQQHMVAIYLSVTTDNATGRKSAAIVDTANSYSVPKIEQALARHHNLDFSSLEDFSILVTHQHLDHCAGAGTFLQRAREAGCPSSVITHPGVKQILIDPSKLLAGARVVYPDPAVYDCQVGHMLPISAAADSIKTTTDDADLPSDDAKGAGFFKALHTQGHSKTHTCFYDTITRTVFSGDSFGVRYPFRFTNSETRTSAWHSLCIPTTSPIDYNTEAAVAAVNRIAALKPERVALTHYGFIDQEGIADAQEQLLELLSVTDSLQKEAQTMLQEGKCDSKKAESIVKEKLHGEYEAAGKRRAEKLGLSPSADEEDADADATVLKLLERDAEINAAGIVVAAVRANKQNAAAEQEKKMKLSRSFMCVR